MNRLKARTVRFVSIYQTGVFWTTILKIIRNFFLLTLALFFKRSSSISLYVFYLYTIYLWVGSTLALYHLAGVY